MTPNVIQLDAARGLLNASPVAVPPFDISSSVSAEAAPSLAALDRRLVLSRHEAAHAVLYRIFGIDLTMVTIEADCGGGVVTPASLKTAICAADQKKQVEADCDVVSTVLMPEHGESRDIAADWFSVAFQTMTILLGGPEGERLSGFVPRYGFFDEAAAVAYARSISMDTNSVEAWVNLARTEACNLLRRYWHCVTALSSRLLEVGTVGGHEIDAIIKNAIVDQHRADREQRRANWTRTVENAERTALEQGVIRTR